MLFNAQNNGDPRSLMYYKNEYYINGTEITLSDEYINSHTFNGKKLWKYARFHNRTIYNNQVAYFFCRSKCSYCDLLNLGYKSGAEIGACNRDYAPYFVLTIRELEGAIEEIAKPIKLSVQEKEVVQNAIKNMIEHPKTDWDYPELRVLWVVYIVAMIGSLIFKQFYILWIIISVIFFSWRKGIVE